MIYIYKLLNAPWSNVLHIRIDSNENCLQLKQQTENITQHIKKRVISLLSFVLKLTHNYLRRFPTRQTSVKGTFRSSGDQVSDCHEIQNWFLKMWFLPFFMLKSSLKQLDKSWTDLNIFKLVWYKVLKLDQTGKHRILPLDVGTRLSCFHSSQ